MSEVVLTERRGPILVVTLNRPAVMNAVNGDLRRALAATLVAANADKAVGAVVITGAGRAFCAGQDLGEAAAFEVADVRAWCDGMRAMYQSVRDLMKPCVAAFNGIAAGAGIQIGLCSDLRITHAGAGIGQPEVRAGLGSIVGSWMIGLAAGHAANVELSLTGGLVPGTRAYELGLVSRIVAEAEVVPAAIAAAEDMLQIPSLAMRLTKERFRAVTQAGFDDATAAGVRASLEAYATGEPQRVMRAFIAERAKRKAADPG